MTFPSLFPMMSGLRIRESTLLTVPFEDWSRVRSPSRARRRMKHGHRQNVTMIYVPDPSFYQINGEIHCHPVTAHKLRQAVRERQP